MTKQKKITAILAAIAEGKTTGKELEPSRRGATVTRLRVGKTVKDAKVDEMYARLMEVTGYNPVKREVEQPRDAKQEAVEVETETNKEASQVIEKKSITIDGWGKSEIEALTERVTALEEESRELRERIADIEQKSIPQETPEITSSEPMPDDGVRNVLGFCLAQSNKGFWYAVKRINGSQYSVYVGRDKSNAENKIRTWCEKKGMERVLPNQIDSR